MPRNDGHTYESQLGADADGLRLLAFLCARYPHVDASTWQERVARGEVSVDARIAPPEAMLRRGQRLAWHRPPWDEPEADLRFTVLHDDADVLAVCKPAGLPTMPGAGYSQSTLQFQARRIVPDATVLHRLGRWTSGVVLFARSDRARRELSRQLRAREIVKRYRALAAGDSAWDATVVDQPIGPVPHPWLGTIHAASADGRDAESRIEVMERRGETFVCDVTIATGRPHQIRIHMAYAGHPLAGDPLYGAGGLPLASSTALPGAPGYRLHATEVVFGHPADGRSVSIVSEPPEILRAGFGS